MHKYNRKNDYNLKFTFYTRLERNLLFRFEHILLVTITKHLLELVLPFFYFTQSFTSTNCELENKKINKWDLHFP